MSDLGILKTLYSDSSFNGWVQFWGLDAPGSRLAVLRGADRVRELRGMDHGRHDVYITKNIMKRANKRGAGEVFAYNSIVIDCDLHDGYSWEQTEAAADALRVALLDRMELLPSVFVRTGRGVQLWFLIKPLAGSLSWLYEIAQDRLFDMIGDLIECEGLPFVLDASVKDAGRVVRLPGSWNYHVQRFGSWEIMGERYAVADIIAELGGMPEKKRKPCKVVNRAGNYMPLCWKQKATIERLCKERGSMQGIRNTVLFLYGAAVYQLMDGETAADALRSLNEYNSMRLRAREVESVIRFYERHGSQKHATVQTFFRLLEMTAEEIAAYYSSGKREAERQAARDRKAERDALILKYYKQGFDKKQIAEAVGVSRGTVYAVLSRLAVSEVREKGANRMRLALSFVQSLKEKHENFVRECVSVSASNSYFTRFCLDDPGG